MQLASELTLPVRISSCLNLDAFLQLSAIAIHAIYFQLLMENIRQKGNMPLVWKIAPPKQAVYIFPAPPRYLKY